MKRLDRTTFPAFREAIARYEHGERDGAPRRYPGFPRIALPAPRRRLGPTLDGLLRRRRSPLAFDAHSSSLPSAATLGRVLARAHGVTGPGGRGPVPSAGGLQALELYLAPLVDGWLPRAAWHYDRAAHELRRVGDVGGRAELGARVPSLVGADGGSILLMLVGDLARVEAKYGDRAERFLLLEAGHLMQTLALTALADDLALLPLGGVMEEAFEEDLRLLPSDLVLYAGLLGKA